MDLFGNCLLLLCLCSAWMQQSATKRVVLLDSTTASSLNWTTQPQESVEDGWTEETFTELQQGMNWRSYVVCDVSKDNANNWLRTPFIERGTANRLGIEIIFTMRDCKMFPYTARTCKETFTLYYHEADVDNASKNSPPWIVGNGGYKLVDRIAADEGRFTVKENVVKNNETRTIQVSKKGAYFAFRDEGACTSILAVKIYYDVCEETVNNFAWFAETPTGSDSMSLISVVGHCVDNARVYGSNSPTYRCRADGKWDLAEGGCQCEPGYQPLGQSCVACDSGYYKASPGIGKCDICPLHSSADEKGKAECTCDKGFFRSPKDPKSAPCTKPPSRPRSPQAEFKDSNSVVISWEPPTDLGGRTDFAYRVSCSGTAGGSSANQCPSQSIQYSPAQSGFNSTKVTISNLLPDTHYTFLIFAENGVSAQVPTLPQYAAVPVTTDRLISFHVERFNIIAATEDSVTLTWQPPLLPPASYSTESFDFSMDNRVPMQETRLVNTATFHHPAAFGHFEVNYYSRGKELSNVSSLITAETQVTVSGLKPNADYGFQVRPYHKNGVWSEVRWVKTQTIASVSSAGHNGTVIAVAIAICFVLVLVIALSIWCYVRSRSRPICTSKQTSDLDVLDYKNDSLTPEMLVNSISNKLASPLIPQLLHSSYGVKQYVDPLSYEDPNQAVREFTNELSSEFITIEEIIGGGEFGDVCRGKLRVPGRPEETVAIKTLKPGSTDKAKADFLTEASIMGQFCHPNVISLRGVVTKTEPVMIITEYMANRSLDCFLRAHDGKLSVVQLVHMLKGIASGMKYLSDINYVHRDLAARNVLVDCELTCKMADFGLSRVTEGSVDQAYTTKGGKIPVRWTSPEAIAFRKFTTSSDVWSFGVVMWEVASFGERPYWDWTNQEVIQAIDEGYRLPPPMDCPAALHNLMLQCWERDRTLRPTFGAILITLDSFLRCPELLSAPALVPRSGPHHSTSLASLPSSSTMSYQSTGGHTAAATVEDWLVSIHLPDYTQLFARLGINTLSSLMRLSLHHEDLKSLGVLNTHHQAIMVESLQRLQQQAALSTMGRRGRSSNGSGRQSGASGQQPQNYHISNSLASHINGSHPSYGTNYQSAGHQHHSNVNDGFFV